MVSETASVVTVTIKKAVAVCEKISQLGYCVETVVSEPSIVVV